MNTEALIQKLWSFCNVLRDDGLSSSDYIEQLTLLMFLKMAEEHSKPPFLHLSPLEASYDWASLASKRGEAKLEHYERILRRLGRRKDLFGVIYRNAISKFRDPAKFERVANEVGTIEWSKYDTDVKGEAYEGLLERTASEVKSGAGQYFTPRPLVDAITRCISPAPGETICDPACGTGGFLLGAFRHVAAVVRSASQRDHLTHHALHGTELVEDVARLCLMNLVLHGIGGPVSPVSVADSLMNAPETRFDVVLANPPFGKRSSFTVVNTSDKSQKDNIYVERSDFWASTSNKQLNFLQHIFTLLKDEGRAAVVVPDNVLFEGGAGEAIRRALLSSADLHTILRLPTGIFYAQGVKANVLFFDRKPTRLDPWTEKLWIYDFRSNMRFTLRANPLTTTDLDHFVKSYSPHKRTTRRENERFRAFSYEELMRRDKANLDILWLEDEDLDAGSELPAPDLLAREIADDLEEVLEQFWLIADDLKP